MPCPVCKVDHAGPCPRLPTPPSTPALQQLTGWVPGSPAELELKSELAKPALMAPTLREFLQKVYSDGRIMKGADNVASLIYDLYSSSTGGGGVTPAIQTAKQFFLAIWTMRTRYPVLEAGYLQYTGVSLKGMAEFCQRPDSVPASKYLDDFLYFDQGGKAGCRLYLNAKLGSIPNILTQICSYRQLTGSHGISAFKAAGPFAAPGRADSIVVYCGTKGEAEALGRHLMAFGDSFNPDVPAMTSRIDPNLGISIGAEPERQATGMQAPPKGYPEDAQSFGTIRSQLIAMAIVNYNTNTSVYGTGFDLFAKFVCVAFRGYRLDPMNPGD